MSERLDRFDGRLDAMESGGQAGQSGDFPATALARRRAASMRSRIAKAVNDLDYYQSAPLGWKHGTIIVWAGMRGVVTLAAAQTLPRDTPERELLVLAALLVAVGSLLLQGLTLPWLVRWLHVPASDDAPLSPAERERLRAELRDAALSRLRTPGLTRESGEPFDEAALQAVVQRTADPPDEDQTDATRELRLAVIDGMRARLLELSKEGSFSSAALRQAQAQLDTEELSIQLRREERN